MAVCNVLFLGRTPDTLISWSQKRRRIQIKCERVTYSAFNNEYSRNNQHRHNSNKILSYSRETALQGAFILAKSDTLELGDNILQTL